MNKRVLWLSLLGLMMCISVVSAGVWTWQLLSSEWSAEAAAAQVALDHSPLNQIETHDIFTGNQVQEVFQGTDVFGRPWVVFVYGTPPQVASVPASGMVSKEAMLQIAKRDGIQPYSVHLGYLDASARKAFQTTAEVVWEIYGKIGQRLAYTYFDAKSGRWIWQYML